MSTLLLLLLVFQTEEPQYAEEELFHVDYVERVVQVDLPLMVWKNGAPLDKLDPTELRIFENGLEVSPSKLESVRTDLVIHFLFDLSTSTAEHLVPLKMAVGQSIKRMRGGDKAKIAFFSSVYESLTAYESDQKQLIRATKRLTPLGSTALYDGLTAGLNELKDENGARLLVLFSDGHDLISDTGEEELETLIRNLKIPILWIHFNDQSNEKPLMAEQTRFLRKLVLESGGRVIDGRDDLKRGLDQAVRGYRGRFLVQYASPNADERGAWRSILVQMPECGDCRLEYRRAYTLE